MFEDRKEAGQMLADEIVKLHLPNPVVLALPRGGVPVAFPIATALRVPLDILIVSKVGAPHNPELAVAAIVDGNPYDIVLNHEMIEAYGIDEAELQILVDQKRPELERRKQVYRHDSPQIPVHDRTVILVDDGAATGTTMRVAIRALKRRSPRAIVVALPVASSEALRDLKQEANQVICLSRPARFFALGYHYHNFPQLTDEEVIGTLHKAAEQTGKTDSNRR